MADQSRPARDLLFPAVLAAMLLGSPACADAPDAPDREVLRRDWHRCVRQAFASQPATVEKRAAEKIALAECRSHEDAYVAAELAARRVEEEAARRSGRTFTTRAREWMSSVAAYVVDPVTTWIGGLAR